MVQCRDCVHCGRLGHCAKFDMSTREARAMRGDNGSAPGPCGDGKGFAMKKSEFKIVAGWSVTR